MLRGGVRLRGLTSSNGRAFQSSLTPAGVAYPVATVSLGHAVGGGHIDVSLEEKVEAVERLPKLLGRA